MDEATELASRAGQAENDKGLEDELVAASREDPSVFISYAFQWPMQRCHVEWQDILTENQKAVIWAPIEHGKSSQISVGRMVWELGKRPNIRAAIVSSAADMSQRFLSNIKSTIVVNERVRRVFPKLRPERRSGWPQKWLVDQIIVQRTDPMNKDPSIHAIGPLGSILGARLDLVLFDDILTFHNTMNPEARKQMIGWIYSTPLSRLTARGRVWFIGTSWHVDDAMHEFGGCSEEGRPAKRGWFSKRYDAEDMLWPELYKVDDDVVYGWPRWRLEEKRESTTELEYDRQMRNIALSDSAAIFRGESVDECFRDDIEWAPERLDHWQIVVGVDLNIRKRKRSDDTVLFAAMVNDVGEKQVLEIVCEKMGLAEIVRSIIDFDRRWRPDLFRVENNAAQDYVVQIFEPDSLAGILDGFGVDPADIINDMPRIEPFTTGDNKSDPNVGIRGMTLEFEQRRWAIPKHPLTYRWKREMVRFNPFTHTGDILMASWFCHATLDRYGGRRGGRMRAKSLGGDEDGREDKGIVHIKA